MQLPKGPLLRSVLHPSDLSEKDAPAFSHALAVALLRGAKLTIVHVGDQPRSRRTRSSFPSVRRALERWGRLAPDSPRSAVYEQFDLRVKKVALRNGDPAAGVLQYLRKHPADLIVVGTRGREGLPRWLGRSVSQPLAREAEALVFYVPHDVPGCVSPRDGSFSARRILVPVSQYPEPWAAVELAARMASFSSDPPVTIELLHVGAAETRPYLEPPEGPGWTWVEANCAGDVAEEIPRAAERSSADLVIMATAGREGFLELLRGSTTERVLRQVPCPLLAVPTLWTERVVLR
jgi:nucleotide-binding universal stress UspA family protein